MLEAVVLCLLAAVSPPSLPESLQSLAGIWGDEKALVDALRARDKEVTEQVQALVRPLPVDDGSENISMPKPPEGAMEQAQKMVKEIRGVYEAALQSYPDNARLHNFYGEWLYDHFGEIPGALKEWHKAIELDDHLSSAYNNLALHNFEYGEYKVGLSQMDQAIKYDKDNPDYLYNLSNVYLVHYPQMGEIRGWDKKKVYAEAMKLSERAAKLSPDDYDLLSDYAVNFFAAENMGMEADWEEAARAWQAARAIASRQDREFYCWLNEARVWLRAKKPKNATACLSEALRLRPDNEVARNLMESIAGTAEPEPRQGTDESSSASPTPGDDEKPKAEKPAKGGKKKHRKQ